MAGPAGGDCCSPLSTPPPPQLPLAGQPFFFRSGAGKVSFGLSSPYLHASLSPAPPLGLNPIYLSAFGDAGGRRMGGAVVLRNVH